MVGEEGGHGSDLRGANGTRGRDWGSGAGGEHLGKDWGNAKWSQKGIWGKGTCSGGPGPTRGPLKGQVRGDRGRSKAVGSRS